MKIFSLSKWATTFLWVSSSLSKALPTEQNTNNNGITKAGNNLSKFTTSSVPVQDTSVTSKYSDKEIETIVEAASSEHSDDVIKQLMLDAGIEGYSDTHKTTGDIEHETSVNGADLVDEEDLASLFKKPDANNPDTVHHRGARAIADNPGEGFRIEKYVDLPNGNCVSLVLKTYKDTTYTDIAQLYYHCFQEHCNQQKNTVSGGWLQEWAATKGVSLRLLDSNITIVRINEESVAIKHVFLLTVYNKKLKIVENIESSTNSEVNVPCPSQAYKYVLKGNTLLAAGKYLEAQAEFEKALEIRHEYPLAQKGKDKASEELAKNTIEPSSSSLTAKDSTLTETSTSMAEANTTQMEPNPAPFEEEAVPTSTPQNQSSYSSQGWMDTKLGQTIVGSLSALVLGSTLKVIHHCWMKTHPESQGVLSYFRSKCFSKPTEDLEQKDGMSCFPLSTITDVVQEGHDNTVCTMGDDLTNVNDLTNV